LPQDKTYSLIAVFASSFVRNLDDK